MKKYINRKNIYLLLILLWISIIFLFSNMSSNNSNSSSKTIISTSIEIGYSIIGKEIIPEEIAILTNKLNYPFRKCMHASVYLILSIFIINAFRDVKIEKWKKYMYTILFCFLWALLDEAHQLCVDGRTGQMLDVWIDTSGSILGCFLLKTVQILKEKRREHTMNKKTIIKLGISFLYIIFSIIFMLKLTSMNIIPNKYLLGVLGIVILFNGIAIACLLVKNKWLKIITILIYLPLTVGYVIGIDYIDKTNNFINKTFTNNEIESIKVHYLLLSKNNYGDNDLYNKDIYYISSDEHIEDALLELNKTITANMKDTEDLSKIHEKEIFFITEYAFDELQENYGINPTDYNVIKKIELEFKVEKEEIDKRKKDSYNIYLAAKDFSNNRIDLNKVITINTQTKEILITNVNRFSYLEIEGRGKNRLSSTGYYGVQYNKKAIEKELGIEIDYYFAVETPGFVELVDAIGGIEYCSDVAYTTTHALVLGTYDDSKGKKLYVKKGCQHLNGIETLTVARERNAFSGWISQRERNANAIIEDILEAAKKPSNITRYPKILESMEGLYKTNIPKETIQEGIKTLLNDKWSVKNQEINGKYGMNKILFGKDNGYVYYWDENSVEECRKQINDLYTKNK